MKHTSGGNCVYEHKLKRLYLICHHQDSTVANVYIYSAAALHLGADGL